MEKVKEKSDITIGVCRDYYEMPFGPPLIDLAEKIVRFYDEFVESQPKSRKKAQKMPARQKSSNGSIVSSIVEAQRNATAEAIRKNKAVFVKLKEKLASRPKEWATKDDLISCRAYHYLRSVFPLIERENITFDQSNRKCCLVDSVVGHARGILDLEGLLMPCKEWKESVLFMDIYR